MKTVVADRAAERADARTRDRVARSLLDHGASTVAELAARVGLTTAAVRRHLDAMLEAGTVVAADATRGRVRGRGRPARRFALTDAGHAAGPVAYDALAADALRYLHELGGDEAVARFARGRMAAWEARYAEQLAALPLDERPAALAQALCDDGFASSVRETAVGVQLCQHHCPVQHVAAQFPVLCEAETEAIARLLGGRVQRLSTQAAGRATCTTHIPLTDVTTRTTTSGRTTA